MELAQRDSPTISLATETSRRDVLDEFHLIRRKPSCGKKDAARSLHDHGKIFDCLAIAISHDIHEFAVLSPLRNVSFHHDEMSIGFYISFCDGGNSKSLDFLTCECLSC